MEERRQCYTVQSCKIQHQVGTSCQTGELCTYPPVRWYCRASSWERAAASGSCSLACGCLQVATALPGCSSHTPPDLHGCCFSPPSLWWVGVRGDPQHLLGSSILCLYALGCWHWFLLSKAKPNSLSLGSLQKQDCFVRYGTMGVSTDCISKHCPAAEGLSALVWKPACSWQAFGCISNGCCLELRQTRIDRQYFHSGWHLSGSPLRSPSDLSSVPREKQLQEKPRFFSELTHTKLHLEANLKASFWVTRASPSLLLLPTSHHNFYVKSHKWS